MTYLEPALPFLLLIGFAGLVRAWSLSTRGRRPWSLTVALLGILVLSSRWAAAGFADPLEHGYSDAPDVAQSAEVIVVLSGSVDPPRPGRPYPFVAHDTYRRLQHAVWLFK